jgi:cold shock CspA family protein
MKSSEIKESAEAPSGTKRSAAELADSNADPKKVKVSEGPTTLKGKGKVKWYDLNRSYGFLTMEGNSTLDVFVHQTSIVNKDHYKGLANDEDVEFEYTLDADGRARVQKCTGKDGAPVNGVVDPMNPPPVAPVVLPPHTEEELPIGRYRGVCKWFQLARGFGFISPVDGTDDIFVHQSDLLMANGAFRSLADGENVEFSVVDDPAVKAESERKAAEAAAAEAGAGEAMEEESKDETEATDTQADAKEGETTETPAATETTTAPAAPAVPAATPAPERKQKRKAHNVTGPGGKPLIGVRQTPNPFMMPGRFPPVGGPMLGMYRPPLMQIPPAFRPPQHAPQQHWGAPRNPPFHRPLQQPPRTEYGAPSQPASNFPGQPQPAAYNAPAPAPTPTPAHGFQGNRPYGQQAPPVPAAATPAYGNAFAQPPASGYAQPNAYQAPQQNTYGQNHYGQPQQNYAARQNQNQAAQQPTQQAYAQPAAATATPQTQAATPNAQSLEHLTPEQRQQYEAEQREYQRKLEEYHKQMAAYNQQQAQLAQQPPAQSYTQQPPAQSYGNQGYGY